MEVEKISIIVDFWTQIKDMVMGKQVCFYVFIFIITLIGGCDQSVEKGILDRYETFEMYADSVFLGFEGDLFYPEIIWGNVDVYLSAFDRMKAHLKVKDDRLTWDFRRGADLNISENIYEYVIGVWQRQNEKLDSGEYRLELVGDNYTIEPIVQKDILSSRTGQFIIPGSHAYNMELLHNSNHYMRTVYGLLEQDNKDEAINIMDSVLTEYEEGELIEYSTNSILNTILSEYYDKSKTNHIEFNIFVEPGFNIECVESMDLVAMVSNLISNAYEAALKSDEKKIKVQMYMQNDGSFIIIKIENSFSGEIVSQGDRLLTTKKDGNIHGVGIESVEKVAEKYDGWVSTSWGNKSFRTMLVLNNSYVV